MGENQFEGGRKPKLWCFRDKNDLGTDLSVFRGAEVKNAVILPVSIQNIGFKIESYIAKSEDIKKIDKHLRAVSILGT